MNETWDEMVERHKKERPIHWRVVKQGQRTKHVLVNGYQTSKELKAS